MRESGSAARRFGNLEISGNMREFARGGDDAAGAIVIALGRLVHALRKHEIATCIEGIEDGIGQLDEDRARGSGKGDLRGKSSIPPCLYEQQSVDNVVRRSRERGLHPIG